MSLAYAGLYNTLIEGAKAAQACSKNDPNLAAKIIGRNVLLGQCLERVLATDAELTPKVLASMKRAKETFDRFITS